MDNYCEAIKGIIEQQAIRTFYQPIARLDSGTVIGYEALSRGPVDTAFESPAVLIDMSEQCHMSWDIELLMRKLAIERAGALAPDQLLFINIDPYAIADSKFQKGMTKEVLSQYGISPSNVIMELTERSAIKDYEGFLKSLKNYVEQGFKIAIDDVGEGYSGMNRIIETRPQFLKLDMNIIRGLETDNFKQAIVKSFVQLSQETNIKLIAEGIETKEELKVLIRLGVYAGQGYYLQRPCPQMLSLSQDRISEIIKYNQISEAHNIYHSEYHHIGSIVELVADYTSETLCKTIFNYLAKEPVEGICITENNYVVGLLTRNAMNLALSGLYGHAVYFNREVSLVMDSEPLIVDYYMPVHKVAELAMNRVGTKMYDPIVIQKGSHYYGLVSVKNLLKYAIEYERNYARELNPLTKLPGNKIINRVMNDVLVYAGDFVVLYFDLDNFKAYNDLYGFDNGDKIIQLTSRILQDEIKGFNVISSFVGHVGGDDYVSILECSDIQAVEKLLQKILKSFDESILDFFNEEDIKRGFMASEDRHGNMMHYDLTSLSVAGAYGDLKQTQTTEKLGKLMADLKKIVKKRKGSCYELVKVGAEQHDHQ